MSNQTDIVSMASTDLAPIILFTYNRPEHTKIVLEALSKNTLADKSVLYVFQDGYKGHVPDEKWLAIEPIVKSQQWCGHVIFKQALTNKGCDQSEIDGVTEIVNTHGKVIVLEDDLVVSPSFLEYMNFSLQHFENTPEVGSINAFSFRIDGLPPYFFLKGGNPWGWATWKRAWDYFNPNHEELLAMLEQKKLIDDWEYGGSYNLLKAGEFWDIKWYASLYLREMLGLFPSKSYVYQIGFDGSGTHTHNSKVNSRQYQIEELNLANNLEDITLLQLEETSKAKKIVQRYYLEMNGFPQGFNKIKAQYYLFKHHLKMFLLGKKAH